MRAEFPFSVLPSRVLLFLARSQKGFGGFAASFMPFLKDEMEEAGLTLSVAEYAAAAFVNAFATGAVAAFVVWLAVSAAGASALVPALLVCLVVGVASFFTTVSFPRVLARRRARLLERDLIPATQQLLIELRSGVILFNAMASVSDGYGELSAEFKKIVRRIDSGTPEIDALQDAARVSPSLQFKRLLWQASNALKMGSDVSEAIEAILADLVRLRMDEIKRYGQELSPWTLVFLMAGIIVPSLGVTLLVVLGSFFNLVIPSVVLLGVLFYLVVFHLFFLNFVGSRRPVV
ncbi:MAG: type II secretion system F family protein [Candidatus Micrarchaeia archaeon]|jgi:flagellar protein FlaJ